MKHFLNKIDKKLSSLAKKVEKVLDQKQTTSNNQINSDDLDFDSIANKPKPTKSAVYGYDKPRNTKTCPNCGFIFDEPPKRGRNCPECKNKFYIRSNNELFNSNLLTEQQVIDAFCFERLQIIGATIDDALSIIEKLKKQWNTQKINPRDVLYSLVNWLPQKYLDDVWKMFYTAEESFAIWAEREYKSGKDPKPYLNTALEHKLRHLQFNYKQIYGKDLEYVYIFSNYCCDTCRSRNNKRVKIEDALNKKPLPFKDCTHNPDKKKYSLCDATYSDSIL